MITKLCAIRILSGAFPSSFEYRTILGISNPKSQWATIDLEKFPRGSSLPKRRRRTLWRDALKKINTQYRIDKPRRSIGRLVTDNFLPFP